MRIRRRTAWPTTWRPTQPGSTCPSETGVRVERLSRNGEGFALVAGDRRLEADNVVVASGAYQGQRVPDFASELDPSIVQLDSTRYRNPSQLQEGGVLVVGAGQLGRGDRVRRIRLPSDLALG